MAVADEGWCGGNRSDASDVEDFAHDAGGDGENFSAEPDGKNAFGVRARAHMRFLAAQAVRVKLHSNPSCLMPR
jgi:hypothetical protein